MISRTDLETWDATQQQVVAPPAPNLRGDQVYFERYDSNGNFVGDGNMLRRLVEAERETGSDIRIVDSPRPRVQVEPPPERALALLRRAIAKALGDTDHYFLADSTDHVTEAEQAAWREYRQALRAASKGVTLPAVRDRLPAADPKGGDPFAGFRSL